LSYYAVEHRRESQNQPERYQGSTVSHKVQRERVATLSPFRWVAS
jgi:hypothetical protein